MNGHFEKMLVAAKKLSLPTGCRYLRGMALHGSRVGYNTGGGSFGFIDEDFLVRFKLVRVEDGPYDFYFDRMQP